jgi:hypothetical protein
VPRRLVAPGRIDPLTRTTHRFGFGEIGTAFPMMQTKEDGMIEPLLTFP